MEKCGRMDHVKVSKKSPSASGLNWRPVVEEYKAKAGVEPELASTSDAVDLDGAVGHETAPANAVSGPKDKGMGAVVNLPKAPQGRSRIDEIAALMLALTYGEMIALADAIWKAQPEQSTVTAENLPAVLHHWSKSRAGLHPDGHE
jgi:hypothetical protein